jgi:hypothetical protein
VNENEKRVNENSKRRVCENEKRRVNENEKSRLVLHLRVPNKPSKIFQ